MIAEFVILVELSLLGCAKNIFVHCKIKIIIKNYIFLIFVYSYIFVTIYLLKRYIYLQVL